MDFRNCSSWNVYWRTSTGQVIKDPSQAAGNRDGVHFNFMVEAYAKVHPVDFLGTFVFHGMGSNGYTWGVPGYTMFLLRPMYFFSISGKKHAQHISLPARCSSEMFFDFAILEDLEVSGFFWATLAQVIPDLTYLTDLKRSCLNLSNGGW